MKKLLFLLILTMVAGSLCAQQYIQFRSDAPQGFSVKSSTASGLSLHFGITELGIADIDNGKAKGQELILKGSFGSFAPGKPNLPVENRYIAVPKGATVTIEVKEKAYTLLNDITLLPAPEPLLDVAEDLPKSRKDMSIFGKDANYPEENVVLSSPTQIRSLDVVMLSVTPFRYNPVQRTLEVIYDMDIEVRFDGGNGQFGERRYYNPEWEHILRDLVINGEMLSSSDYYSLIKSATEHDEAGCEYLIITPDDPDIMAWADTLKAFRTKQGILTKVVNLSECGGNNPETIRNYILNAYNNWTVPPAAVLLFGGWRNNAGIRPFTHLTVPGDYGIYSYSTDYPYCDMNGDSLADIAISRMTANNLNEYQAFVKKTIQYESEPPTDNSYYDHPIISSGHEDNKWFMISTQSINGFYRDKLGKQATDLYMIYSSASTDSIWSTGYNADVLMDYFGPNGQNYIPASIGELHDWKSRNDKSFLENALKEGSFMTLYRDHSVESKWLCPEFYIYDIQAITNEPPTFVLSITCSTSRFDTGGGIVDAFCLKPNGGAIGGIGATSLTHTYFNDILAWGIYDCIWPNFLPDMGSNTAPDFIRPAYVLSEAKHYLNHHFFLPNWWPDVVYSTMHLFCYTGETYLNLYTESPEPIEITHGVFCPVGTTEFTVDAEDGAVVCLSKDGEIIGANRSNGQPCTFMLPQMEIGEHFTVTATKQNHFRYEYKVYVIPNSGSHIALETNGFIIENEYNILHNNEDAHIGLVFRNYGNDMAGNVTVSLSCESPYIEITQGSIHYQNMAAQQTVAIDDAFRFHIAYDIPDMTEVTFTININDGHSTQDFRIVRNIVAPIFVIQPEVTMTNESQESILFMEKEGITDIHFQIANEGHFNSGPVDVHLEMLAPFVTIDSSYCILSSLEKGCSTEVVFRVNAHDSSINEAQIKTGLSVTDGILETVMNTILPYGNFKENFESGNFSTNGWQTGGNVPWIITDEEAHTGSYSARTGQIEADQTSDLSFTRMTEEGEMSFFRKVSSHERFDLLWFYIDNELKGYWSGEEPWAEERFPLSRGYHTFKWSYQKTDMTPQGENCAWIDDICFPPARHPIAYSGGTTTACKDESVVIDGSYAYDYQNLSWTTSGDGNFNDNGALHPTYTPGAQDKANGGTTLQLHVNGSTSPLQLILANEISLGDGIIGDNMVYIEDTPISHYSIEGQEGIDYIWQLEPEEAGVVFSHGHTADIVWSIKNDITEATLSVAADATCSQAPLSKSIQLSLVTVSEQASSCFALFPNPTDGIVNIILGQDLQGKSTIEVYNVLGTRLTNKTLNNLTQGESITIDLQHYTPGIYIIKLCSDEGCWSQKLIIR
ncbi:MAG: T9SS type A sorting domain-containing protein [Bacteroidales bacterium]|nr:T9SS type A sorting domain-containing protein [Bacteroidales bacterium]